MSRILKPVSLQRTEYLQQICARYFIHEHGFRIIEFNLGNTFTGNVDLLAATDTSLFLITIGSTGFADALLRSLTGYRWFRENRDFLRRIYPPEDINIDLPVCLIILSLEFPPEIPSILDEVCSVPVGLYRYRLLGSADDPDIFIEDICSPAGSEAGHELDPDALRKELGIEHANLSDDDIREFFHAMRA